MNDSKVVTNFKKSKSLIEKIIQMKENDEYCIDIMQQNLAVIGMLRSAHEMLMEEHLRSCFSNAVHSGDEEKKERMVEEIAKVAKLYNKL